MGRHRTQRSKSEPREILQTNSERTPRKHPQSREEAARNEQFFRTFSAKKDHFRKWWSELYQNPEPLPCRWILVHSFSDGEALYCAVNCTKPLDQSAGTVLQLTEKRKPPPGTAADVLRKRVDQSRGFIREKVVK